MSFKVKSTAELEAMTAEQLDTYKSDLANHEKEVRAKEISEATKAVKAELQKEIDALTKANQDANERIDQLKEQTTMSVNVSKTLAEEIKENKESISAIIKGDKNGEVVVKAAALRASISNNIDSNRLTDIGQLGVKKRSLYDFFTKIPIGDGTHKKPSTTADATPTEQELPAVSGDTDGAKKRGRKKSV